MKSPALARRIISETFFTQRISATRRGFLAKTLSTIGAGVLGLYMATAPMACSSPTGPEPPPPPPTKITLTGKVLDLLNNMPISGAEISGADSTVTTDGTGQYALKFNSGTTPT